ncbi:MAG: bifunctional hydroxymethylpyrimidine kinase/phosphomethylpyrimidine kinase [Acidimicrobiales bacterium]|nr:bifunctional hydroxymethylpyrimidine kinase/phosphomethylpyrimidine kinase [Acidimicrobiales bacterium]
MTPPVALTIAGSDSGGGAGLQADLRTFAAHGVHGASVVTAITAQNTVAVRRVDPMTPESVGAQLDAVLQDLPVAAAKTGFLPNADIVATVATATDRLPALVVDPVMVNSVGAQIVSDATVQMYRESLVPRAAIATPNLHEAAILAGRVVDSPESMVLAAKAIGALGPEMVIVKGGSLPGAALDIVWHAGEVTEMAEARIVTPNNHGTGCSLAAALAAGLATGGSVDTQLARSAKAFVTAAIAGAASWRMGSGRGPIDHFNWG